jgi:hypothetical protein
MGDKSGIVIYRTKDGEAGIDVNIVNDDVWLSLNQLAVLFRRDKSVISRHIRNVFKEKELEENSVVAYFATTGSDGKIYNVEYYNLDAIICVGNRVKSKEGTKFRIWARKVLKDHLVNGFTANDNRLRELQSTFESQKETYIQLRFFLNKFLNTVARKDVVDSLIERVDDLGRDIGEIREIVSKIRRPRR